MKKILLITTGGTIASMPGEHGLTPLLTSKELLQNVPEVGDICKVTTLQLFDLDSTNICHEHWLKLADCIRVHYEDFDGFVVTHGTDTMAYTAAAISYLVQNNKKPVVFTGSQKSIALQDSDARRNMIDAFLYAVDDKACGTHLIFDGKIILGTRAKKIRTKSFNAFASIDYPEVGIIRERKVIHYLEEKMEEADPVFYDCLNPAVFVIKMIPGMRFDILDRLLEQYDGIIIESFGSGGIPQRELSVFQSTLKKWESSGKSICFTTQVTYEGSDMEVYQVGKTVSELPGVLDGRNMTLESITAKLMWIQAITTEEEKIKELFHRPVAHDIL